ncbi:hypothetical protein GGR57DRAFT_75686 [Xylariaceae sp. FL1272]|nr:hypothetical protein GGR57DRAFT_75686 [Xylariaceae sp. FL1272]
MLDVGRGVPEPVLGKCVASTNGDVSGELATISHAIDKSVAECLDAPVNLSGNQRQPIKPKSEDSSTDADVIAFDAGPTEACAPKSENSGIEGCASPLVNEDVDKISFSRTHESEDPCREASPDESVSIHRDSTPDDAEINTHIQDVPVEEHHVEAQRARDIDYFQLGVHGQEPEKLRLPEASDVNAISWPTDPASPEPPTPDDDLILGSPESAVVTISNDDIPDAALMEDRQASQTSNPHGSPLTMRNAQGPVVENLPQDSKQSVKEQCQDASPINHASERMKGQSEELHVSLQEPTQDDLLYPGQIELGQSFHSDQFDLEFRHVYLQQSEDDNLYVPIEIHATHEDCQGVEDDMDGVSAASSPSIDDPITQNIDVHRNEATELLHSVDTGGPSQGAPFAVNSMVEPVELTHDKPDHELSETRVHIAGSNVDQSGKSVQQNTQEDNDTAMDVKPAKEHPTLQAQKVDNSVIENFPQQPMNENSRPVDKHPSHGRWASDDDVASNIQKELQHDTIGLAFVKTDVVDVGEPADTANYAHRRNHEYESAHITRNVLPKAASDGVAENQRVPKSVVVESETQAATTTSLADTEECNLSGEVEEDATGHSGRNNLFGNSNNVMLSEDGKAEHAKDDTIPTTDFVEATPRALAYSSQPVTYQDAHVVEDVPHVAKNEPVFTSLSQGCVDTTESYSSDIEPAVVCNAIRSTRGRYVPNVPEDSNIAQAITSDLSEGLNFEYDIDRPSSSVLQDAVASVSSGIGTDNLGPRGNLDGQAYPHDSARAADSSNSALLGRFGTQSHPHRSQDPEAWPLAEDLKTQISTPGKGIAREPGKSHNFPTSCAEHHTPTRENPSPSESKDNSYTHASISIKLPPDPHAEQLVAANAASIDQQSVPDTPTNKDLQHVVVPERAPSIVSGISTPISPVPSYLEDAFMLERIPSPIPPKSKRRAHRPSLIHSSTQTEDESALSSPGSPAQDPFSLTFNEPRPTTPAIELPDFADPKAKALGRARSQRRTRRRNIRLAEETVAAAVVIYATAQELSQPPEILSRAFEVDQSIARLMEEAQGLVQGSSDVVPLGGVAGECSISSENDVSLAIADLSPDDEDRDRHHRHRHHRHHRHSSSGSKESSRSIEERRHRHSSSRSKDSVDSDEHRRHHRHHRRESDLSVKSISDRTLDGSAPSTPKRVEREREKVDSGFESGPSPTHHRRRRTPEEQAAHDKRKAERKAREAEEGTRDRDRNREREREREARKRDSDPAAGEGHSHRSSRRSSQSYPEREWRVSISEVPVPGKKFFDMKNGESILAPNTRSPRREEFAIPRGSPARGSPRDSPRDSPRGSPRQSPRPDKRLNTSSRPHGSHRRSTDMSRSKSTRHHDEPRDESRRHRRESTRQVRANEDPKASTSSHDREARESREAHRSRREERQRTRDAEAVKKSKKDAATSGFKAAFKKLFT